MEETKPTEQTEPAAELPELLKTMAAALGTIHKGQQVGGAERGQIATALAILDQALAGLGKMVRRHELELVKLGELVSKHHEILTQAIGQPRTKPTGDMN